MEFDFIKLNQKGVETLVDWARVEGWNPGINDASIFYKTDPDGFFGYFRNGEMIGGGSLVSYNGQYGFMGFFIIQDQYRGMGIGRRLWRQRRDHLLQRLDRYASVGMDGVVAMQPFYAKGGFEMAFRDERYERKGENMVYRSAVSYIDINDLDAVLEYDLKCFLYPRSYFMQSWVLQPGAYAFKYQEGDSLQGFCVMRKATTGYKIGPLFADNPIIAEDLYKACLHHANGESVFLDIPVTNRAAVDMIQKFKAKYVFECARMYYGKKVNLPIEQIFGITSFELG